MGGIGTRQQEGSALHLTRRNTGVVKVKRARRCPRGSSHQSAEAAVAARVFRQILLMVLLRVVELRSGNDLRRDLTDRAQRRSTAAGRRRVTLPPGDADRRRRSRSLSGYACRHRYLVASPASDRDFPRTRAADPRSGRRAGQHDEDRFGVPGHAGAHLAIGGIRRRAGDVAHRRGVHAVQLCLSFAADLRGQGDNAAADPARRGRSARADRRCVEVLPHAEGDGQDRRARNLSRGGHVLREPAQQREQMRRNLEWFAKWMGMGS